MNRAEGEALVAAWRQSGLSQSEFGRHRGINVQRLQYWERKVAAPAAPVVPETFVVMSADDLAGRPTATADECERDAIEIVVDDRFFVRVPATAANLGEVLRIFVGTRS